MLLLALAYLSIVDDRVAHASDEHGIYTPDYWYFDPRTYNVGGDECRTFGDLTEYDSDMVVRSVSDALVCTGLWCRDSGRWPSGWNCPDVAPACYQVEHIIPLEHDIPELEGCNVNIYGNAMMVFPWWRLVRSHDRVAENRIVYGSDIFDRAYSAVLRCCKST